MAIIEGLPRSPHLLGEEESELLVLEGIDFYRLCSSIP
jgi:hypothetical protein